MTQSIESKPEQSDFSDFENKEIESIIQERNEKLWFGEKHLSFKKRLYQFIATLITTLLVNFGTKRIWQLVLVLYLLISLVSDVYFLIKWIYHLIF